MIRMVSLFLSFALVSGQTLYSADRTLAAEGDNFARTKTGDKVLSHWQLWHLSSGEYEVIDTSAINSSTVQIFRFNSQFFPIGYTCKFGPTSWPQFANAPTLSRRMIPRQTISCQYGSKELSCTAESSEGHKSTSSIAAKTPYVFIGEFLISYGS